MGAAAATNAVSSKLNNNVMLCEVKLFIPIKIIYLCIAKHLSMKFQKSVLFYRTPELYCEELDPQDCLCGSLVEGGFEDLTEEEWTL